MKITGDHTIDHTTPAQVWDFITNSDILAKIIPGLKHLEAVTDDRFKMISEIKIGPVKARFEGDFALTEKAASRSTTVVMRQNSKIGNVQASIGMTILSENGSVTIRYDGEATMAGKIATMGQRMAGSLVRSLSKRFFMNLEKEINNNS